MEKLTVRDLYTRVNEDDVFRFEHEGIDGSKSDIIFCQNNNGTCIQMNTVHARSSEEKVECLKQFCEQKFGGGTLIIYIDILESHFDDYDLFQNGFYQLPTDIFAAYNPKINDLIEAFALNDEEKTKMLDFVKEKMIAPLQRTADKLASLHSQLLETIDAIERGEFPDTYRAETEKHMGLISKSLNKIQETYGITPVDMDSVKPIGL